MDSMWRSGDERYYGNTILEKMLSTGIYEAREPVTRLSQHISPRHPRIYAVKQRPTRISGDAAELCICPDLLSIREPVHGLRGQRHDQPD